VHFKYGCKRGGSRLPAPRPQAPQALTQALAAARIVPQSICGLCGGPRMQPRQREAICASKLTERFVRAFC